MKSLSVRSALTALVLTFVTSFGGTIVVVTLTLVAFAFEARRRPSRALFWFLLLVVAGQSIISSTIKWAVDRARPDIEQLASFSSSSFPSGHATTAAAAYAALALVLGRGRAVGTRAWLAGAAAAIGVAVAATRVLLGVHWVTDVVAGLALGWSWFALCAIAFGGRLLHFGAPLEPSAEERAGALAWLLRPVFICGHHRSGTTLLQSLLDGHPQLLTLPNEGTYFTSFAYAARAAPSTADLETFAARWIERFVDPNFAPHFRLGRSDARGVGFAGCSRSPRWRRARGRCRRASRGRRRCTCKNVGSVIPPSIPA